MHNSRWLQSPGRAALTDAAQTPRLRAYVQGVIAAFAKDDRVLAWDLWNEPDNTNDGTYSDHEPMDKAERVAALLPEVFAWARAAAPAQPLTSAVTGRDWSGDIAKIQLAQSDFISFHNYDESQDFEAVVKALERHNRPLVCSEYMARPLDSTFAGILPIAAAHDISMMNWGFVRGKTQTHLPWDSWQKPYQKEPEVWFHDIFRADGTPYIPAELAVIRAHTRAAPAPVQPGMKPV